MKYIRTKDEVYEYEKAIDNIKYYFNNVAFGNDEYNIDTEIDALNKSILKQADTIEELCDCCVCFIKDEYQPYICPVKDIEHLRKLEQFGGKIGTNRVYEKVYLAIWTNKGLIYVAKMNDKGCLELL